MSEVFSATSEGASAEDAEDLGRARAGDDAAFNRLVEPLRRELHAHCYRMLGSTHDADDALQDALLRAWRGLARFEGRSSLRSWLYTVATHTCLDTIESRGRRALPMDLGPSSDRAVLGDAPLADVAWLGPYPDAGLGAGGPAARYEQREAVELAFVAALQHLPGNQRAALLLFEVLGFSAAEIASTMNTSTTSVNSALARARKIVAEKVPAPTQQRTLRQIDDARVREIVAGYSTALERGDADALVALLTEDAAAAALVSRSGGRRRLRQADPADLLRQLAAPPGHRERPARRGLLPPERRSRGAPRLVDQRTDLAWRAHPRGHLVHRRRALHVFRAARLTALRCSGAPVAVVVDGQGDGARDGGEPESDTDEDVGADVRGHDVEDGADREQEPQHGTEHPASSVGGRCRTGRLGDVQDVGHGVLLTRWAVTHRSYGRSPLTTIPPTGQAGYSRLYSSADDLPTDQMMPYCPGLRRRRRAIS
ncbi:RNA polymerase subunit sigma-70 [Nonomuraea aurantiaca]|uniref:RNA polymerase subunit sigma-70 n=1 Tax=Nonomuraea aurantiaca TaxID=2878562 RepID=UPI001CD97C5E|nr:RNA polymerase subunit sigma-70 [Nonomuraea aurantiaca]MCA2223919.1 RNA polymerase subunit sigma-70 [Nonomuraea aurantiaca]